MNNLFELDPYPGNAKILFIGLGVSTHTHSWIGLLANTKLNIRLFSVPGGGVPPVDWKTHTYVCSPSFQLPEELDPITRQSLYPLPKDIKSFENEFEKRKVALEGNIIFKFSTFARDIINFAGTRLGIPPLHHDYARYRDLNLPNPNVARAASPEEWLAKIIQDWQPDIIHTLGLFDGQGGVFYSDVRKRFRLEKMGLWILQLRGGSDIALRRYDPEIEEQISDIFRNCDQIITDNHFNIEYIRNLGFADKVASIAPVPGTGGMEIPAAANSSVPPSRRQRSIFWPKAYETIWSKSLPVIEAIKLAWDRIKPCEIYITATNSETEVWLATLPEEIRRNCHVQPRIPREQVLEMMRDTRVMLAPSLVDGVPNVLYEAMANGAFPIVSPLESIIPVVREYENVLFARNLYPEEISNALIRAMDDDDLVNNAAQKNLQLAAKIADRGPIALRVSEFYERQLRGRGKRNMETPFPLVTIITPTYNRASFLDETVKSVLSQDYPNIEYLILDDGSKDNTKEVMKKYQERVVFRSHDNIGETRTVNKGFGLAKGEFICVVNSDDPILPGAITKLVSALRADPEALAVYPDWVEIDPRSMPIREMRLPDYDIFNMLNDFNVATGPGNIFKRSALEKYGFRDTNRRYTGDLEFWFRLASHGKLLHVPEVLATHRTHPDSASVSEKSSKLSEELLSIVKSLFASGALPREIQDRRSKILSRAYYVSVFYCSNEPVRKLKYSVLSFFYDPFRVIGSILLIILRRIYAFVIRVTKAFLHIILPEKTYNALREWRQSMRKTNP
jgi:glycosyltransferase involved in cell wall biosynthesis